MRPRNRKIPGAQGANIPEGSSAITSKRARGWHTWRGVRPWRARKGRSRNLGGPGHSSGEPRQDGEPVDPISDGNVEADARVARPRRSIRPRGRPKARGTGAEAEGGQGVGGLNTSEDAGKRVAPGAGRAKAARVGTSLVRETWTGQRTRRTCQRDSQG